MTKDRTAYWREYARKNSARRKEISAAFRERNREKIREANRAAWAAGKGQPRKKPSAIKPKVRSVELLRQKFAAFRAGYLEGVLKNLASDYDFLALKDSKSRQNYVRALIKEAHESMLKNPN